MSIKGQDHSLTLAKGHSEFKVKCLTLGFIIRWAFQGLMALLLFFFYYFFLIFCYYYYSANSKLLSLLKFSYFITPYDAQASSAFSTLILCLSKCKLHRITSKFYMLLCTRPSLVKKMDGWMTRDFTSFLTVFQSYQDDVWMIMKGCVQWDSVYGWEDFTSSEDRTRSARSVGQRLTHWATGAP